MIEKMVAYGKIAKNISGITKYVRRLLELPMKQLRFLTVFFLVNMNH